MKIILTLLLSFSLLLHAAPAFEHLKEYYQKDGTRFKGTPKGDEYLHYIETEDKQIALFNRESGYYEYAIIAKERGITKLVPSGIKVINAKSRKRGYNPLKSVTKEELHRVHQESKKRFHNTIKRQ